MEKQITIVVDDDIESSLADITCYFAGLNDAKGEDWPNRWIMDSVRDVKQLKQDISSELKKLNKNQNES